MPNFSNITLKARHLKCFGDIEQGFDQIKSLNLLIGRNNSGKSALIDLLEVVVNKKLNIPSILLRPPHSPEIFITQPLTEGSLRAVFKESTSGGDIPGSNHWDFGKKLVGQRVCYNLNAPNDKRNLVFPDLPNGQNPLSGIAGENPYLVNLAKVQSSPFANLAFRRLSAERNIVSEIDGTNTGQLSSNGVGATNLIQTFLNKAHLPRDLIEITLLKELNTIFQPDVKFTGIHCRQIESGPWEIYLREDTKGAIPLSQSGSGLKTVILALLNIHVMPIVLNRSLTDFIFAFEELENNLHPALLRRLLSYLDQQAKDKGCAFVLSTHSNVAIDIFNTNPDAQIIHVTHDGTTATARSVHTYIDNKGILDDLDVRASDLLQSNGIIWVEGPTDRIYLNRWISLWSDGLLKEGVHYQCVFYGGRLLAHISAAPPGEEGSEALPIFRVNKNAIVMIDSDRKNNAEQINATKRRIQGEIEAVGGFAWVTAGKEIENYLPAAAVGRWLDIQAPSQVDAYENFFADYLVRYDPKLGHFATEKPLFAEQIVPYITKDDLKSVLDLANRLDSVCSRIRQWNNL